MQVVGVNRAGNLAVAQKLRREIAKVPGIADVHLHQITDRPDLRLDVDRIMASELGLTQQDVAGSVLVSLSSTSQVAPNFWVNPTEPRQLPRGRADAGVSHPLGGHPAEHADHQRPNDGGCRRTQTLDGVTTPAPPQLLSNLVDLRRTVSPANVNHYNVQPVFDVYANVQGGDLAARGRTCRKPSTRSGRSCRGAARSSSAARSRA